jgi:hypothetical protein
VYAEKPSYCRMPCPLDIACRAPTALLGGVQGKLASLVAFGDPGHRLRRAVLDWYGRQGPAALPAPER